MIEERLTFTLTVAYADKGGFYAMRFSAEDARHAECHAWNWLDSAHLPYDATVTLEGNDLLKPLVRRPKWMKSKLVTRAAIDRHGPR